MSDAGASGVIASIRSASRLVASHVTIVAFDGIIADTLPPRALALADAAVVECAALGVSLHAHDLVEAVASLLPGRTFIEAVTVAVRQLPFLQHPRIQHDLTAHDLIAMRAQRAWAQAVAHGVALCDGVIDRVHHEVAHGRRMVVRSDSQRREVEPLLRLAGLEDIMMFVRCSDDVPHSPVGPTLRASYEAISARLERQGVRRVQRDAVEADNENATFALEFVATSRTVF